MERIKCLPYYKINMKKISVQVYYACWEIGRQWLNGSRRCHAWLEGE